MREAALKIVEQIFEDHRQPGVPPGQPIYTQELWNHMEDRLKTAFTDLLPSEEDSSNS